MAVLQILITLISLASVTAQVDLGYFKNQEIDISSLVWANSILENSSLGAANEQGCVYCGEFFHPEPPPNIMFLPPPPLHPHLQGSFLDSKGQRGESCEFCRFLASEDSQHVDKPNVKQEMNNKTVALLIAFLTISGVLLIYLVSSKRARLIASLSSSRVFKANSSNNSHQRPDKSRSLNDSLPATGAHLADPCFFHSNRDKNLMSPIISDQSTNKKTSIPSKYWAQPGSVIGRTVRRIPNEYEFPSSRTNSTGTSSAVYADMNNENAQRFFSPYNLHTYAEVREVLDPNEPFQTSSNSSVMLSESNYDNSVYPNNNIGNGAPNGSVQMSDFNSSRNSHHPINYGPMGSSTIHNPQHHNNQIYEHPPQRAQVIITSNNQGVNPTLLNYKERVHNVI